MMSAKVPIELIVNGKKHQLEVSPLWSLSYILREKLKLVGTKTGCERGMCGTCTVIENKLPIFSCLRLGVTANGKSITTIEGVAKVDDDGSYLLHPLQRSFIQNHGMQCGACTAGMIMAAKSLYDKDSNYDPSMSEIRKAISGHICRCGTYPSIIKSIFEARRFFEKGV